MTHAAARTIRLFLTILVVSLVLLLGGRLVMGWYIRREDAAIQRRVAAFNQRHAQFGHDEPRAYTLPGDLLSALRRPEGFQMRYTVADIPGPVRDAFVKPAHIERFSMAEPGAKWQSTDVVIERGLPTRRLIAVATDRTFCLVFYEHGGFEKSNDVAAFRLSAGVADVVWHAFVDDGIADPARLSVAIHEKRVDSEAVFF